MRREPGVGMEEYQGLARNRLRNAAIAPIGWKERSPTFISSQCLEAEDVLAQVTLLFPLLLAFAIAVLSQPAPLPIVTFLEATVVKNRT